MNQIGGLPGRPPEGTRGGAGAASSRVRTEFPLGRYGTAAEVKQAVLAVEYMERGTMTGWPCAHMVEHSLRRRARGPRELNVPRVGLVFTDGRSQDNISVWAARAKEEGGLWRVGRADLELELDAGRRASEAQGAPLFPRPRRHRHRPPWAGKAVEEELREIAGASRAARVLLAGLQHHDAPAGEPQRQQTCPGERQAGSGPSPPFSPRPPRPPGPIPLPRPLR